MTLPSYEAVARDTPVALLPVRLETRFGEDVATTSGNVQVAIPVLRVRIYPDDISVDDHEPGLGPTELAAGRRFWTEHEALAATEPPTAREEARLRAWHRLVESVGGTRLAYVARATRDPAAAPPVRSGARSAPTARLLPDAWVVTGWAGGQRIFSEVSAAVRSPLAVGPAPVAGRTTGRGTQPDAGPNAVPPPIDPLNPLLLDEGSRWLADYDLALAAGMAVTVPLQTADSVAAGEPPPPPDRVIDHLFVFGLRVPAGERTVASEAAELAGLFATHHARDGAGFLSPATPTNNTEERPSGWSPRPDPLDVYRQVVQPPPLGPAGDVLKGDAPLGVIAASALGLAADAFAEFANAAADDLRYPRLMNEALFPVTWGELIGQLLVPSEFDATKDGPLVDLLDQAFDFTHDHLVGYVRGGGPLPVLRLGRQPYGVLPVTDLSGWRSQPEERDAASVNQLVTLLGRLRAFWDVAARHGTQLSAGSSEAIGRDLADILGLGPTPHPGSYWVRPVTGELSSRIFSSTHPDLEPLDDTGDTAVALTIGNVGRLQVRTQASVYKRLIATVPDVFGRARLVGMSSKDSALLRIPIAETDPAREQSPTPAQYLRDLGGAAIDDLNRPTLDGGPIRFDLLYQLTHRSLLLANEQAGYAAMRAMDKRLEVQQALKAVAFSAETVSFKLAGEEPTIPSLLGTKVATFLQAGLNAPAVDPGISEMAIGQLIGRRESIEALKILFPFTPTTELFLSTRAAVHALGTAGLSDATYVRLLGETLAVASNRLDAWITSVATRRLESLRARRADGVQLGSYGWLTNLVPSNRPAFANAAGETGAAGLPGWDETMPAGPIVAPERTVGYVHAPSLGQAKTGAILRAGELAHETDDATIARVDLTSGRVRTADWILRAVRNGQPLGAVLGYRLERLLHERSRVDPDQPPIVNLHRIVDDLRVRFPQRGVQEAPGAQEEVAPREVVDGLLVWQAWSGGRRASVVDGLGLSGDELAELETIMASVGAAVDAVADLIVAEGVHQIAAGDHGKAGATFTAIAGGGVPPSEFDLLRSPRSGAGISHRVVVPLAAGGAGGAPGWDRSLPRAGMSPDLERWVEERLGSPADWAIDLAGEGDVTVRVTLADAGPLCALDVLAELPAEGGDRSALVERLAAATTLVGARIALEGTGGAAPGRGWPQLAAYAATLADLLAAARPLTRADLADPAPDVDPHGGRVPVPEAVDEAVLADLQARLFGPGTGIVSRLETACAQLAGLLPRPDEPVAPGTAPAAVDETAIRPPLAVLAGIGLPGSALGTSASGARLEAAAQGALASGLRLLDDVRRRRVALDGMAPGTPGEKSASIRLDALQKLVQALLGQVVVLSPGIGSVDLAPFRPATPPGPDRVDDWVVELARVRRGLANLADVRLFGDALERPATGLSVVQRPLVDSDGWLGDAFAPATVHSTAPVRWEVPDGPRAHLVLVGGAGSAPADVGGGIVIDEFLETIPAATQVTGVAVHYDAPDARPPQSILLAVHPDPAGGAPWSWELVERMLADTLDLARLRTVELDQLAVTAIDDYLPAIYVREGIEDLPSFAGLLGTLLETGAPWTMAMTKANLSSGGDG